MTGKKRREVVHLPIISQNLVHVFLASVYFAQRFLSRKFSTCFLSFITLPASSSLPFFSVFLPTSRAPVHFFLTIPFSCAFHLSTPLLAFIHPPVPMGVLLCSYLMGGNVSIVRGTEVRTARQPVKLLSCSCLGDWLTGRLQWRGKRSLLALPQMAQYTASCKSRFTYFLCLIIFFFSLQNFLQDGRK